MSKVPTVAIIGGGFAGVVSAIKIVEATRVPVHIVIVGREKELGRGIAYSTDNVNHLVNGPAKLFGIKPETPLHLAQWLEANAARLGWAPPADTPFAEAFAPRWIYGHYVQDALTDALATAGARIAFEHVQGSATQVRRQGAGFTVDTDAGVIHADLIVLATGLQVRKGLRVEGAKADQGRVVSRLWDKAAWAPLAEDRKVMVLGSGLTALDTLISAEDAGFQGEYVLLSRRGLLVQARADVPAWPDVLAPGNLPTSLREVVAIARQARRDIRLQGGHRQQLTGALRPHLPALWQCASDQDKQRFIRYLRPYWEHNLHRAAPESGKRLEAVRQAGRLNRLVGRLVRLESIETGQVRVVWKPRGAAHIESFVVDRVIDAHGYEFDWTRSSEPLVKGLLEHRLVVPHPLGFGIQAEPATGQVLDADALPVAGLYAVGHPLRGVSWESNAIGEQVAQAINTSKALGAVLASAHHQRLESA